MIKLFQTMKKSAFLFLIFFAIFRIHSYAGVFISDNGVVNQKQITGIVKDARNEALPGATIVVKGTTIGVITDMDGKFTLNVPENASILVVSFLGYISQEVAIGNHTSFEVTLASDEQLINEIVVVGYGKQSKTLLSSSVASIGTEKIAGRPLTSFTEAMAAQIAGVQVQQTSGAPGGGFSVKIRGTGSISSSSQPLYVVDGVPIDNIIGSQAMTENYGTYINVNGQQAQNPMSTINPNDIQSIDILKDAASTAIYGSRGSNGVVLITTKQGAKGKPVFSVNISTGIQSLSKKVDMMNLAEYVEMETQRRNYQWVLYGNGVNKQLDDPNSIRKGVAYKIPVEFSDLSNFNNGKGTDWQDELFRNAPITNAQLSVSGGNDKTNFYLSSDAVSQEGILLNTGFKKISLRANVDTDVSNKVKIGYKINPSYSISSMSRAGGYGGVIAHGIMNLTPDYSAYEQDGSYSYYAPLYTFGDGTQQHPTFTNPVAVAKETDMKTDQLRLLSSAYISVQIIKNLTLKSSMSTDVNVFNYSSFTPSTTMAPGKANVSGSLSASRNINWVNENIITYASTFKEKHNLNIIGGVTEQKSYLDFHEMSADGFPNDNVHTLNAGTVNAGTQYKSDWSLLSVLTRVSYDYDKKYLFMAAIRGDGSSRFGSDTRWGMFPSVSAGWRVSQENFMKNLKKISELKLRASYGVTGNNDIGNYASIGNIGESNYILGSGSGAIANGLIQTNISNRELSWEQTKEFDLGFELGLFQNRIYINADYYNSLTTGLLLDVPVPLITGFNSALQNIGKVRNRGLEISIDTKNIDKADFTWSTNFNISFNRNKVEAMGLSGAPIIVGPRNFFNELAYITEIGQPIGSFYGLKCEGVYMTKAEADADPAKFPKASAGDFKFKDISGADGVPDGKIDGYDNTVIGNNQPDFIYGFSSNLAYKGFDFSFLIQGVQGSEILMGQYRNQTRWFYGANRNYWKSEAEPGDGKTPNPGGINENRTISSWWVKDGSYLRVKNVTLGYNIPAKVFGNVISKARVYVNAENLFTFTSYPGFNPEVNSGEGDDYAQLTPGLDFGTYPLARTISFGINLTF